MSMSLSMCMCMCMRLCPCMSFFTSLEMGMKTPNVAFLFQREGGSKSRQSWNALRFYPQVPVTWLAGKRCCHHPSINGVLKLGTSSN